jgi:RNA polymerase sigma factor (sigma-70 family)
MLCDMNGYYPPIAAAMRAKGFKSQLELRKAIEKELDKPGGRNFLQQVSTAQLNDIVHGTVAFSLREDNKNLRLSLMIAGVLGRNPEELFPLSEATERKASLTETYGLKAAELDAQAWAAATEPDQVIEDEELRREVHAALKSFEEPDRRVLYGRFFEDKARVDIAKERKVVGERIRQIENEALRRLRFPSRSRALIDAYLPETAENAHMFRDDEGNDKMKRIQRYRALRTENAVRAALGGPPFEFD